MKGIKTTTSLQVGDLIRVKTGQTVYSFAGETGNTEPDDAIAGDNLGEVTKLVGSSVVFKDLGNRIRNTVSIGGIDFSANPNFDYQLLKEPKTETTFEYIAEMEGWEYLTHFKTASKYRNELAEINERTKPISKYIKTTFKIPETCKIIDTTEKEIAFILISNYNQFIVNRFATKKHIQEIMELDKNIL